MKVLKFILIFSITQILFGNIKAQNITENIILAKKYYALGDKYYSKNKLDSSNIFYQKSADIYKQIAEENNDTLKWEKYVRSLYDISWNLTSLSKFEKSINILDTALINCKKYLGEEHKQTANIYYGFGEIFKKKLEYNKALKYYFKSLKIRKNLFGEKHFKVADSYQQIGLNYRYKSEYNKALKYYFKSLKIRKELLGEKHIDIAKSYNEIGIVYRYKSEYNKALKYYFKSLKIKKELLGEKHINIAKSYDKIGIAYSYKSEYNEALKYYFKSLKIRKELLEEKHINIAKSYDKIGIVYYKKFEYNKSLEYYFKALKIYKKLFREEHNKIADFYNNIGLVYSKKKENNKALEYYLKSLDIYKKLFGEISIEFARCYNNIGLVYDEKLKFDKALENYLKALKIKKEILGEKDIQLTTSYNNIGISYMKQSKYDKALEYYFKSLNLRKELLGKKHVSLAISYYNIGVIYYKKSEYENSLEYYQKGIVANCKKFNDTTNIYSIAEIKDYLSWYELLTILQAKALIFTEQKSLASLKIAKIHYQACDTLISQVRKEMKTKSDKISLGKNANEVYKRAINLCLQLHKETKDKNYLKEAFYFSEKNKSSVLLESLAGAEAQKFAGIPDTLLNLEHKLSVNISNYKTKKNNAKNDSLANVWGDKLFNANRSYDSLMTVFETQYPKYYDLKYNNEVVNISEIQKQLDKNTAVLSYFLGDSLMTIFAITRKKYFVSHNEFNLNKLDKDISDFRNFLSNSVNVNRSYTDHFEPFMPVKKEEFNYPKKAYEFYNLIFPEEIKKILSKKKIENLIIIPDGKLASIPFEVLQTEENYFTDKRDKKYFSEMPYLLKKYNISYNYSATLFNRTTPKEKTKKIEVRPLNDWMAFAPVFDNEKIAGTTERTRNVLNFSSGDSTQTRSLVSRGKYISPLPGTEEEIENIFFLYEKHNKNALMKTHLQANENFLKSGDLENYKIIHFATHGFVNEENPQFSGILFAQDTTKTASENEGILYQSEIYNLKLNADLTVLSACETGLGKITKGEGVIGLTRALLYAGSKNIIVSLWSVNDASTSKLMINFYGNLLENEENKFSKHLQKAKLQLIQDGKYSHPYFWSPFILIGE